MAAVLLESISHRKSKPFRVVLVATGGTIAMKRDEAAGGAIPAVTGKDLVESIPSLSLDLEIDVQNFSNQPSSYFTMAMYDKLTATILAQLAREDVDAVIVSHGTDTMEETAFFLDTVLEGKKPVILVGAQKDASNPEGDGPKNLSDAFRVARHARAGVALSGVLVVMGAHVFTAQSVVKAHTSNIDGFSASTGEAYGYISDKRVVLSTKKVKRQCFPLVSGAYPRVEIIPVMTGADALLFTAAIEGGAQGLVVQGYGAGNVSDTIYKVVKEQASRIPIIITTRVQHGPVKAYYAYEGGGQSLLKVGAILAEGLTAHKARLLLLRLLALDYSLQQIRGAFAFYAG